MQFNMEIQHWLGFVGMVLPVLVPVMIIGGFVTIVLVNRKRVAAMSANNYKAYANAHPDCVKGDRAKCNSCGSGDVGTERVMDRMYFRRHFCRKCGNTLYYSPEN